MISIAACKLSEYNVVAIKCCMVAFTWWRPTTTVMLVPLRRVNTGPYSSVHSSNLRWALNGWLIWVYHRIREWKMLTRKTALCFQKASVLADREEVVISNYAFLPEIWRRRGIEWLSRERWPSSWSARMVVEISLFSGVRFSLWGVLVGFWSKDCQSYIQ